MDRCAPLLPPPSSAPGLAANGSLFARLLKAGEGSSAGPGKFCVLSTIIRRFVCGCQIEGLVVVCQMTTANDC